MEHKNIKIIDRLVYEDVPPFIASCDMGLCLYNLNPEHKFYRSPLKLFDYMACELPVISTRVGQINEVVKDGENGILVDDNDIDEIAGHILGLKKNKKKAKEMGRNARRTIKQYYHWRRVAAETERILEGLVSNN